MKLFQLFQLFYFIFLSSIYIIYCALIEINNWNNWNNNNFNNNIAIIGIIISNYWSYYFNFNSKVFGRVWSLQCNNTTTWYADCSALLLSRCSLFNRFKFTHHYPLIGYTCTISNCKIRMNVGTDNSHLKWRTMGNIN